MHESVCFFLLDKQAAHGAAVSRQRVCFPPALHHLHHHHRPVCMPGPRVSSSIRPQRHDRAALFPACGSAHLNT